MRSRRGRRRTEQRHWRLVIRSGFRWGFCCFLTHFTSWKFSLDPTPLEVEMRLYEENVNKTLIQNEERKEDDIDVS